MSSRKKIANMVFGKGEVCMTKTLLWKSEQEIKKMEEEIVVYRREKLPALAPSSFSYRLYELYLQKVRNQCIELKEKIMQEAGEKEAYLMEQFLKLLLERMTKIKQQDCITLDDYPADEMAKKWKENHEKLIKHLEGELL